MSGYDDYVNYKNATDQIQQRVQQTQRNNLPRQRRRHTLARKLHSFAERLDT